MRHIVSVFTLLLALAGGTGAAMASPRGEHTVRRADRHELLRERIRRPEIRGERFAPRFHHGWRWIAGRYVRC